MKRGALFAALLLIPASLLLSGCWDQRQISDLVVVMGVGIDIEIPPEENAEEIILLTVELARITAENTDGTPVLATAGGTTMTEAVRNLAQSVDKKLHWSHMQFLLIGEEAARLGVDRYLSLFYNNKDMSPHIYFALCEGEAGQALAYSAGLSPYASGGLHDILLKQRQDANGYVYPISLQMYMSEHSSPRCGMLVPMVGAKEEALYFRGMAVLDENTKYVHALRDKENSGAALLLNQMKGFAVALTEPNMKQNVTVELTEWQIKPSWRFGTSPGDITLILSCVARGVLVDEEENTHYSDKSTVGHLEQLFFTELSRQMQRAWQRSRGLGVDFLGLGTQLYRHYPQKWDALLQEWPQMLWAVNLQVEITGKVDVAGQSR